MPGGVIAPIGDVLVATDFSEDATRALARALRLPLRDGSVVHLLHVLPRGSAGRERAAAALRDRAREASRTLGVAPTLRTHVACGTDVAIEIVRRARAEAAELVVCGRRGVNARVRTGSLMRIVREAELPLLVVTADATEPYQRALVAITLTDVAPLIARQAMSVLGEHGEVHLAHVLHVPFNAFFGPDVRLALTQEAEAQLARVCASVGLPGVRVSARLVHGERLSSIVTAAARTESDLVVVGSHGRGPVRRALFGSLGESLIGHSPWDVLVSRPLHIDHPLPE